MDISVFVRLHADTVNRLYGEADARGVSVSEYARELMADYFRHGKSIPIESGKIHELLSMQREKTTLMLDKRLVDRAVTMAEKMGTSKNQALSLIFVVMS